MSAKLFACAFIVIVAYLIFLDHADCASIRRKKRKGELSSDTDGNLTLNLNESRIDGNISLISNLTFVNHSVSEILSTRVAAVVLPDVVSSKESVVQKKSVEIEKNIRQAVKQLEGDDHIESKIVKDSDSDDNNGAGAGNEVESELFEHIGVENVIENIVKNLTRNISMETGDDEGHRDILRFRPNENDGRNLHSQRFGSENKPVSAHLLPVHQRTSLIPLKIEELQLPDHVDGLRMEHDGHLNREYKKEVLLGNHEEFEWESESKLVHRLKVIFKRADKNRDGHLDLNELQSWIMYNVQSHLEEAVADNKRIFVHLDTNSDKFVTWKEFYIHFLLAKGHDLESAKKHSEDYESISLDPDEKERIIRYKFRWAEADENPQDNQLTFSEFMNFRHPEQSKSMLVRMVNELMNNFDKNGDELITEEEFLMMSPEIDPDSSENDKQWLTERKKEFREVIDLDKNGVVDEAELKVYVDPHNSNLAKLEAENLIRLADQDADGRLSLNEVLENAELFLGSKVVDASRNFHDEF